MTTDEELNNYFEKIDDNCETFSFIHDDKFSFNNDDKFSFNDEIDKIKDENFFKYHTKVITYKNGKNRQCNAVDIGCTIVATLVNKDGSPLCQNCAGEDTCKCEYHKFHNDDYEYDEESDGESDGESDENSIEELNCAIKRKFPINEVALNTINEEIEFSSLKRKFPINEEIDNAINDFLSCKEDVVENEFDFCKEDDLFDNFYKDNEIIISPKKNAKLLLMMKQKMK